MVTVVDAIVVVVTNIDFVPSTVVLVLVFFVVVAVVVKSVSKHKLNFNSERRIQI